MATDPHSDTSVPDAASPGEPAVTAPKAARSIRAILNSRAEGSAKRGGSKPDGKDMKVPPPPYGTRRSMGKR